MEEWSFIMVFLHVLMLTVIFVSFCAILTLVFISVMMKLFDYLGKNYPIYMKVIRPALMPLLLVFCLFCFLLFLNMNGGDFYKWIPFEKIYYLP